MLKTFLDLVGGQFEASLCTLHKCIEKCPDDAWDGPVVNLSFNQAVFHTLFFTDLYLGNTVDELRGQEFHQSHKADFVDYEELEDRKQQNSYSRAFIKAYVDHCRGKGRRVIPAETESSLAAHCGFAWLSVPRSELYVYIIRHVQHHAAQLSLRLRQDHGTNIRWVRNGWREED